MTGDDKKALDAFNNEADKVLRICFVFGVLPLTLLLLGLLASCVADSASFVLGR